MYSGSGALLCVRFTETKIDAHVCNNAQCHEHACIFAEPKGEASNRDALSARLYICMYI